VIIYASAFVTEHLFSCAFVLRVLHFLLLFLLQPYVVVANCCE